MDLETAAAAAPMILRFDGQNDDGEALHELRASHVAEVLQGLVGFSSDMAKAGVFGDGPAGSEILVRPPREGSWLLEVIQFAVDSGEVKVGVPSLATAIWWATRHARAEPADVTPMDDGTMKINWQDNTVDLVPRAAWEELQKRKPRRKKQLRQIMAPLSDPRVTSVEVQEPEVETHVDTPNTFTLERADYDAVRPEQEVEERHQTFEVEGQMSAIDFDNPKKWRIKTVYGTRSATVADDGFLGRVAGGLPIRKDDIFWLDVRVDTTKKNGKTRNKWTVMQVRTHRRAAHDDDG